VVLTGEPGGRHRPVEHQQVNTYAKQIESFAAAVTAGERATPAGADDLLRTMRALEGSYASCRTGQFVEVH
jgi:predicted dehydrogenase